MPTLAPASRIIRSELKRADSPLTFTELVNRTTLPPSTLSHALDRLERKDVIERESSFVPLSQVTYQLS